MLLSKLQLLGCLLFLKVFESECIVRPFPKTFKFGVSTAAYQIEGAWNEDGKAPSIWDEMVHQSPSVIDDHSTGDVAADSYHQYKRDIEMLKEMNVDFYRFSIAWTRILPSGFTDKINRAGVDYYNNLITELLNHGIEPVVTMYHWDLPLNLQKLGGFANPLSINWFENYAGVLFTEFGDRVKTWITINEPKQICYEGYGSDGKAPMLNMTGIAEYICAKNVLLAHAKAYKLYQEKFRQKQNGQVGIAISFTWYEPASKSAEDVQGAQDARQFDWGQYCHPIFSKHGGFPIEMKKNIGLKSADQNFPQSRLPELTHAEVALIKGSADFLGVNSYTTKMVYRDASVEGMYAVPSYMDDIGAVMVKKDTWPQSHASWLQSVPWGFHKILQYVRTSYNNPLVYVTENGWSTGGGLLDIDRIKYYRQYLNALLDAMDEGSNIKRYAAWSLMDNFEWKHGYSDKFGLYEVDFENPERTRTPRKSAFILREVFKNKVLDSQFDVPNSDFSEKLTTAKTKQMDDDYIY